MKILLIFNLKIYTEFLYIYFFCSIFWINNLIKKLYLILLNIILLSKYFITNYFINESFYIIFLNNLINLNLNFIIILTFIFFSYKFISKYIINTIIFIIIILELNINVLAINNYSLNINLLNGLFLIHPILIYLFYSLFISTIFINFNKIQYINLNLKFLNIITYTYNLLIKNIFKIALFVIVIAISLGCWWAFQELNWGTWWNWDLVELINLFLLITTSFYMHSNFIFKNIMKHIESIKTLVNFFLCILLVRYNLIQSIHNFISIDSLNQYIQYIYYIIIIYLTILFNLNFLIKLTKYKKINYFFKEFLFINIFYIIIINLFYNFKLNSLQNWINIYIHCFIILTLFTVIYIFITTKHIYKYKSLLICLFSLQTNAFIISLKTFSFYRSINKNKILHLFVLIFVLYILNNYLQHTISLSNYIINQNKTFYMLLNKNNFLTSYTNLNVNMFYNEYLSTNLINSNNYIKYSKIDEYFNQPSHSTILNTFWLENFDSNIYIYIYTSLTNLFIFLILLLPTLFYNKYKIRKIY